MVVEYLLKKGCDPDQSVFFHADMRALTAAAGWSDVQMLGLLLEHGATIKGSGALVRAAEKGRLDNVEFLLSKGADVNEIVATGPSD